MTDPPEVPDRGDVVCLSFHPQAGREQHGRRPAVVLSPAAYNGKVGLALLCPIASRSRGYPFEVALPEEAPVHGVVLADRVESLDWRARGAKRRRALPDHVVSEILAKLGVLLAA